MRPSLTRAVGWIGRAAGGVRHVTPVAPGAADGLVGEVYARARREFLLVGPFTLHSPEPELLAGFWALFRETLATGAEPRADKEAVAAAVSRLNACPYCVDAHALALQATPSGAHAAAVERGDPAAIRDPRLRGLCEWAAATRSPGSERLARPPFSREAAPEIVGTAFAFHYVNRMVNVFLDPSPLPLPAVLAPARGALRRLTAPALRGTVRARRAPGASLDLLPAAELPADLVWAAGSPHVAGALARFAAAVEGRAATVVSEGVRALLAAQLAAWRGEDPGPSRAWVEEAIAGLPEREAPAARLALLTALASHQVGPGAVEAWRRVQPGDAPLVALCAWASLAATRRIGSWMGAGVQSP